MSLQTREARPKPDPSLTCSQHHGGAATMTTATGDRVQGSTAAKPAVNPAALDLTACQWCRADVHGRCKGDPCTCRLPKCEAYRVRFPVHYEKRRRGTTWSNFE